MSKSSVGGQSLTRRAQYQINAWVTVESHLEFLRVIGVLWSPKSGHEVLQWDGAIISAVRSRIGESDECVTMLLHKVLGSEVSIARVDARHDNRDTSSESMIQPRIRELI